MAAWPSGKAEACKAFIPSSNLGAAFFVFYGLNSCVIANIMFIIFAINAWRGFMKKIFLFVVSVVLIVFCFNQNNAFAKESRYGDYYEIFSTRDYYHAYRGVKNSDGKIVIKPLYFSVYKDEEDEGGYYAELFHSYVAYSLNGKKLLEIPNASIEYYSKDFVIIKDEKGYYLADNKGKKLTNYYLSIFIEPIFKKLILFIETNEDETAGVMNKTGKVLIKPVNNKDHKQDYEYLYSTKNGGFVAGPYDDYNIRRNYDDYEDEEEASIFFIDANGVKTPIDNNATSAYFEQYEKAKNKYPLYMPFWQEDKDTNGSKIYKWGIDLDGENNINAKYEEISIVSSLLYGRQKYFAYKEHNLWGVKTLNGEKTVLKPQFKNEIEVVDDYILVNIAPKAIYFGKDFKKKFELYDVKISSKFKDGYAAVSKYDGFRLLYGFINENGELVIDCKYDYADYFYEGLARVKNEKGLEGYIDKTGKIVIDFQYSFADDFKNGVANVRTPNGRRFKIDKTGKEIGEK